MTQHGWRRLIRRYNRASDLVNIINTSKFALAWIRKQPPAERKNRSEQRANLLAQLKQAQKEFIRL